MGLDTGSHFLANADWGCMDDEHKAWFFLEIDNKDMALSIVLPTFASKPACDRINHVSARKRSKSRPDPRLIHP